MVRARANRAGLMSPGAIWIGRTIELARTPLYR